MKIGKKKVVMAEYLGEGGEKTEGSLSQRASLVGISDISEANDQVKWVMFKPLTLLLKLELYLSRILL